ncbi:MAG: type II secretion system protein [bacterium]|nr:type II secretion system protein [bacterium]
MGIPKPTTDNRPVLRSSATAENGQPITRSKSTLSRQGFTLVEVIIAVAIMVILLGLVLGPMLVGFDYFHKGDARVDIRQNAVIAMDTVLKDIREAMYVYVAADGSDVPLTDNDDVNLWVVLPVKDTSGNYNIIYNYSSTAPLAKETKDEVPVRYGHLIHYYTDSEGRLMKRVYTDATTTPPKYGENAVVGKVKTETKFNCSANGIVTVDITVIKTDSGDGTEHRLHLVSKARPMIK